MKMPWSKCFFLLLAALLAEAGKKHTCPPEFVRVSSSCYYFSRSPETWHEAHFECRDRDANLAVVQKKWQDRSLRFYLNHSDKERVERWIGGIYNWKAKVWIWGHTGKTLRYRGFPKKKDAADNRWKCIAMNPDMKYRWTARSCIDRLYYICEIPIKKNKKSDISADKAL